MRRLVTTVCGTTSGTWVTQTLLDTLNLPRGLGRPDTMSRHDLLNNTLTQALHVNMLINLALRKA